MFRMKKNLFLLALCFIVAGCSTGFKNSQGEEQPFQIHTFLVNTPAPTVMVSHGSGCLTQNFFAWARELNAWGYNAIVIDHCSARGVNRYTGQFPPKNLAAIDKAKDYAALAEWVKAQDWHKGKIAVVGFSRGGAGVLMFANDSILKNTGELNLAQMKLIDVGVAYYPGCTPHKPPKTPHLPVLIHHGLSDNLAVPTQCNYPDLTDPNYHIVLYEGVYHTFDVVGPDITGTGPTGRPYVARRYNREADLKSRDITRNFLDNHLKN